MSESFFAHELFAFRGIRVELFGLGRLTIRVGRTRVGVGFGHFGFCPPLLHFSFMSTDFVFGIRGLLSKLRGFFTLSFTLHRGGLAADCDEDPHDDQDHDDGDNNPDDG
ncbi:hypothetical protein [Brevibacterium sp. FAM 27836]|uniref:hypothetical protein n=1 Tax=Brevibacterium sp. FAM 27836 TaxID=3446693 RepID=UPI003F515AC2